MTQIDSISNQFTPAPDVPVIAQGQETFNQNASNWLLYWKDKILGELDNLVIKFNTMISQINTANTETNDLRNETEQFRNETEQFKNTTKDYRDEAVTSANEIKNYTVPTDATYDLETLEEALDLTLTNNVENAYQISLLQGV